MDIGSVLQAIGLSPLVAFVVAVVIDDAFGIALAVKSKTFDLKKLPSFLESQFGTKEFLVVATAAVAAYLSGGDVKAAATAVVVAGGAALLLSVLKDIYAKALAFVGKGPAPAAKKAAKTTTPSAQ